MIELAEVIAELRTELDRARTAGSASEIKFGLGPVELELTVAVDREAKAGAKVKFWVAEIGTDGKLSATNTQRIKITLQPTLSTSAPATPPAPAAVLAVPPAAATVYIGDDAVEDEDEDER